MMHSQYCEHQNFDHAKNNHVYFVLLFLFRLIIFRILTRYSNIYF